MDTSAVWVDAGQMMTHTHEQSSNTQTQTSSQDTQPAWLPHTLSWRTHNSVDWRKREISEKENFTTKPKKRKRECVLRAPFEPVLEATHVFATLVAPPYRGKPLPIAERKPSRVRSTAETQSESSISRSSNDPSHVAGAAAGAAAGAGCGWSLGVDGRRER